MKKKFNFNRHELQNLRLNQPIASGGKDLIIISFN
jgi:hypothetical protein